MANSIDYASRFLPVIDDIYKEQSVTEGLDTNTMADFSGANEIKVLKVETTGLGDYSRIGGYPTGDIIASWETMPHIVPCGRTVPRRTENRDRP